jgi:hypothetical protein
MPVATTWRTDLPEKLAVTDLTASMVTLHVVAVPVHAPMAGFSRHTHECVL